MIITEFKKHVPMELYTPISVDVLIATAKELMRRDEVLTAINRVGLHGDFSAAEEVRLNQGVLDFVTANGLLNSFNDNYSISIALCRKCSVDAILLASDETAEFCDDKISNKKRWGADLSPYSVLPTLEDMIAVCSDVAKRPEMRAIYSLPQDVPQYDVRSSLYDPEYVSPVARFPKHIDQGTRNQWPSYAYYLLDKSQYKYGLVNRCQKMNGFVISAIYKSFDRDAEVPDFSHKLLQDPVFYAKLQQSKSIDMRAGGSK